MMKRLIVLVLMVMIAPLIVAATGAQGVSGSGHGCACPMAGDDDSSPKKSADTGDDKGGRRQTGDAGSGSTSAVTKGFYELMPDMDIMMVLKLDSVVTSPVVAPFILDRIGKSVAPDVSINRGTVGKTLSFTKELVMPEADYMIFGAKLDWPKDIGKKGSAGLKIKDMMIYMSASGGNPERLKNAVFEKMNINLSNREEEFEGMRMVELTDNPTFCDRSKEPDCRETPMFVTEIPDNNGILISGRGMGQEFLFNYKHRNELAVASKAIKDNSAMYAMLQNSYNGDLFIGVTTPLADFFNKALEDTGSTLARTWNVVWTGSKRPETAGASISINFVNELRFEIKIFALNKDREDFTFTVDIGKDVVDSINWAGLKDKIFDEKGGIFSGSGSETCNSIRVEDCNRIGYDEEACTDKYVMLKRPDGSYEPHNCEWGYIPDCPESAGRKCCFTQGRVGENGVCSFRDGAGPSEPQ